MRKYHQKQLLELVETLHEAHAEIKRLLSGGETQAVIALLSDCQESAARIGRFIEQLEGGGTKTVGFLEEYCELLYQLSVAISNSDKDINLLKPLQKLLFTIENGIRTELGSNKIEVVFLPYQLSMFDSFESIYLAAKEDPNCDAYVMPIPYFELNADGSLGKMHYDGDKYPSNIEVVDWRNYSIEARHPDIVFTHYPYDDNTTNVSIHPDFYSKHLRDHTDLLCYVPYYVALDNTVEEYNGFLPGIVYADHVIVESEVLRKSYIDHYKKADRKFGWNGQFGKAEEKFIALGSPKYDKVINSKREDFKLPEEWLQRLSGKKVIFFNTHMFAWIDGGERYFEKLRHVFDIFRSRSDVVLWWRPHPNTELNFRLKCPQRLNEYYAVIDEFKRGDWGIYDDTPDLHRAIAWSDAYYGDWSSLVALYGVTGKPVMCSDVSTYNPEVFQLNENSIYFLDFNLDQNNNGWAYSGYFNALCKLDLSNFRAELRYRDSGTCLFHTYLSTLPINGKILALPYYSDRLLIYDVDSGNAEHVSLKSEFVDKDDYGSGYKLGGGFHSGDKVYMLGNPGGVVPEYSISNGSVSYNLKIAENIEKLSKKSNKDKNNNTPVLFLRKVSDSVMWFARAGYDTVIEYNFDTLVCEKVAALDEIADCENMRVIDEFLWIVPKGHQEILRLNYATNEITKYNNFPDGFRSPKDKNCFSAIHDWGIWILLLPAYGNMVLRLNKASGEIMEHLVLPACGNGDGSILEYDATIKDWGDKKLFFQRYDRAVYEFVPGVIKFGKRRFILSDDDYREYVKNALSVDHFEGSKASQGILWDSWFSSNPITGLCMLMDGYTSESSPFARLMKNNIKTLDGNCGKKIFQTLLDRV